jgi:hypothetical protein
MSGFFGDQAWIFSVPALLGTAVFVLKLLLAMLGADDGVDADFDTEDAFSVVSTQSVAAFVMGAGWTGLGAYRGSELGFGWSLVLAGVGGLVMGALAAWLLKAVWEMQSSGNIDASDAVGKRAEVYVTVPARREGKGQVRVVINDSMVIYDAVTEGEALDRSAPVLVTRENADGTLTVARA